MWPIKEWENINSCSLWSILLLYRKLYKCFVAILFLKSTPLERIFPKTFRIQGFKHHHKEYLLMSRELVFQTLWPFPKDSTMSRLKISHFPHPSLLRKGLPNITFSFIWCWKLLVFLLLEIRGKIKTTQLSCYQKHPGTWGFSCNISWKIKVFDHTKT